MGGLVSSEDITISGISMQSGGWFTMLATNITTLHLTQLNIDAQRDALDIVSCRHVRIDRCTIRGGGDDAVALKSDYSLGSLLESYDIVVSNSHIGSNGCNALQFGSETVGPFYNILFENITVTSAG